MKQFFNKIKARYSNLKPTSVEAQHVQEIKGMSEKLQKLFEDALLDAAENQRIVGANSIANSPAKMEIKKDINGNTFVDVTEDILADAPLGEKLSVTLAKIVSNKFKNRINANGQVININATTNNEWRRSPSAQKLLRKNEFVIYDNKQRALANADELLITARNWVGEKNEHLREDDIAEFARGNIRFRTPDTKCYEADILTATKTTGAVLLYDIINISEIKITEDPTADLSENSRRISETSVTDESVSQDLTDVNTKFHLKDYDSDYMSAVERGDMATAQRLVNEVARRAGYNSPLLYHGTTNFGFTEFDLSKMDDKRSISLTSSKDIVSTYSSVRGTKRVSENASKDVYKMRITEIAKELNSFVDQNPDEYGDARYKYEVYNNSKVEKLNDKVKKAKMTIETVLDETINEFTEKLKVENSEIGQIALVLMKDIREVFKDAGYADASNALNFLLQKTDVFYENSQEVKEFIKDMRLVNALSRNNDIDSGVIVESALDGIYINILSVDEARNKLTKYRGMGNYALYAKMKAPLVIDGKGKRWNEIKNWSESIIIDTENTKVDQNDEMYSLVSLDTNK